MMNKKKKKLDYSVDVITQFDLPPRRAAERILCHSHQITLSNIHTAYMSQLDGVFVTVL